jgi:DNA-binding LacI/PurR family transcriptional regulator
MSCQGEGVTHRKPTIIDVARRAGVSKSLVSMALRGDPGVSQARREAVLDAAAQLGYRPNRAASILAGTRTDTGGVIVEDLRNPWSISLLEGIREALVPHGLRLTLTDAAMNRHLGAGPVDEALSLRVDGLIMAAEALDPRAVPAGLPLVVAGAAPAGPSSPPAPASETFLEPTLIARRTTGPAPAGTDSPRTTPPDPRIR